MALTSMPYLTIQELDANGAPYAGAKLFFYAAGTTTKQDTYADANGNSANANPVVLDAAGRATVFFQPLTYDVVLAPSTDSDPPVAAIWTRSGIVAIPTSSADVDVPGTAGESLSAGNAVALSDGTGGRTAGRWYKTDADSTELSTLAPQVAMVQDAIASGSSGSIRIGGRITGLSGLTEGVNYYASATAGAVTSSAPANARLIGTADSTTSMIVPAGIPFAGAAIAGLVSTGAQTWTGVKTMTSPVLTTPSISAPDFTALPTGVGAFVTNYATGNTTKTSNTTLVDVPGLSFAVLANKNYQFMFFVHLISTSIANFKFTLTGPAAPTAIRYGATFPQSSIGASDASAFSTNCLLSTLQTLDHGVIIMGLLRNGANAGTVQFQFAQSTSEATNTVVYADSSVIAWRIS